MYMGTLPVRQTISMIPVTIPGVDLGRRVSVTRSRGRRALQPRSRVRGGVAAGLARGLAALLAAAAAAAAAAASPPYPFNDATLPAPQRAADLLARLTLHEKVGMLFMDASMAFGNDALPKGGDLPSTAVPRLGVPQFNWMSMGNVFRGASNGCKLGCCTRCPTSATSAPPRAAGACCTEGNSTQLPQGTGVAATWNADLVFALGVLASDEARGFQNGFPGGAELADYRTGASSVINILRDGRWGRAPETYGECPILTGEIAVAFNKGLMGFAARSAPARPSDAIKVLPVVRHFVAYAGPDGGRFSFDAIVSEDDLRLTFLPAWRRLAAEGALGGVMSAISALNSIPSAAHKSLLTDWLRGEAGFDGFVMSDCDTIPAISEHFAFTASIEQAAAAALQAGGDLNCGPEYALILNATLDGFVSEPRDVDPAVLRLLTRRVQVGDLDAGNAAPPPYTNISYSVVDSPAHRALARQAVRESVVLLSNGAGASAGSEGRAAPAPLPLHLLPGDPLLIRTLLVVGPSADDASVQAHTYHGTPAAWTTVLEGLREVVDPSVVIQVLPGCERRGSNTSGFSAAIAAAAAADAVVYVGGLEASIEEEGTDRGSFALPGVQLQLIQALHNATSASGVPVVVVIVSGGPVSEPWMSNQSRLGWLWASYFGQDGAGIADVIAGAYSPSGRLPFTMPFDATQVGDIADYDMRGPPFGRTYRYLRYADADVDGFAQLNGLAVDCNPAAGCLQGPGAAHGCDNSSVPGECSFTRGAAVSLCAAWPECAAVTCSSGRPTCQARGDTNLTHDAASTTSFLRSFPSTPLFPFAHGLSYSNVTIVGLEVAGAAAGSGVTLGDTVLLTAALSPVDTSVDFVVAIFGEFLQCDGSASPVPALPRRTLLAFTKVAAETGAAGTRVPLSFALDPLRIPGVERQAFPGRLRLWAGDGGACAECPNTTVELVLPSGGCGLDNDTDEL